MIRWLMMWVLISVGLGAVGTALAAEVEQVDIAVQGMSCPFCVYNVEKKLRALPGVERADVDLGKGQAHVVMRPGMRVETDRLRQAIVDAGFTPGAIDVVPASADAVAPMAK